MKCLACGAEMRLIDVRTDTTTPFGIERHVFQCSSCRQNAQRLRFDRSKLPITAFAAMTPAIRRQGDCSETPDAIALKAEAGAARVVYESHPRGLVLFE